MENICNVCGGNIVDSIGSEERQCDTCGLIIHPDGSTEELYNEEIKPCPFCGNVGELNYRDKTNTYIVECTCNSCVAYWISAKYDTKDEAIYEWNKRF